MMNQANINILWGSLIIEELFRCGVEYFCLSPGSRSTPLTAAAGYHDRVMKKIHFDERGAAFHALGYVRATGRPAALICTSGTATANYLPAVVEASLDHLPLILLTADRPPELHDTGANQTITQPGLYGRHVRWQFDLPCPNEAVSPAVLLTTVDQAVYRALNHPRGAVHLNCMFREPLAPEDTDHDFTDYLAILDRWTNSEKPYTSYAQTVIIPDEKSLQKLTSMLSQSRKGLFIVGRLNNRREKEAVLKFSRALGWPVFPDILSGLRLGNPSPFIIPYYDRLLQSSSFRNRFNPDLIVHLGGRLTSKRLLQFLENIIPEDYVVVTDHPERCDPTHKVTFRIQSDIAYLVDKISSGLTAGADKSWLTFFEPGIKLVEEQLEAVVAENEKINVPAVARLISQQITEHNGLFIASSLPIRDMDMFADYRCAQVATAANRGASGIDGTLAAASGFAVGLQQPVTLYTGDLAMLHDLNSLALLKNNPYPVTLVIINNNGGGIFSFLPISAFPDILDKYFITPHDWHFEQAAAMFGLDYYRPADLKAFNDCYRKALDSRRSSIIEVIVNQKDSRQKYLSLQSDMITRLNESYW